MGTLVDGVTGARVMAFGRRGSVFVSVCLSQDGRSRRSRLDTQLEDAPQEVRHAQQEHAWSEAQTHVTRVSCAN